MRRNAKRRRCRSCVRRSRRSRRIFRTPLRISSKSPEETQPEERKAVEDEIRELDEILARLKTGSAGPHCLARLRREVRPRPTRVPARTWRPSALSRARRSGIRRKYPPWMLVDVPGTLDTKAHEEIALEEAKWAIGHLFVIDGEPDGPRWTCSTSSTTRCPIRPRSSSWNKWDMIHGPHAPRGNDEEPSSASRRRWGASPPRRSSSTGQRSAHDPERKVWVRQRVKELETYPDGPGRGQPGAADEQQRTPRVGPGCQRQGAICSPRSNRG